ncbi:hypothetical protein ACV8TN_15050 [Citrobacter freundii]
MKQKFIEWFTKNNNGCSPAMEDDRSFVREKTQHMFEAYQAGVAEGEARCAALAAENAGLKVICEDRRTFIMNGVQLGYIKVPTVETDPALETIRVAVSPQEPTPATDAFLAEVRASAIPDEATERDLFEEWVMEKICVSKTTLEGLRTDDGYRNSTLSGTDYNGMWSQWKAIRAAKLQKGAAL